MNKAPTIYEVAQKAGVSITTVSRFLNDPDKVAPKTRVRIEEAMKELEFVPKADAVARARQGAKRIGILTPFLTAQSFVERLDGIHEVLKPLGYEQVTYVVDSVRQLHGYLSMLPVSGRIDGLIVMALPLTDSDVESFASHNIPVVGIEVEHPKISSITIDDRRGGGLAASYLAGRGYRQMGFLGEGGEPHYSLHATDRRLEGFRDKLQVLGLPMDEEHVCFHPYGMDETIAAAKALLAGKYRPDALFCASDFQAVGVIKAAKALGIAIPEELGVLGFDDTLIADYMEISTIRQSLRRSGEKAAGMIIDRIRDPGCGQLQIGLNLNIVERHTT